jgi:hypothetical protein
VVIVPEPAGSSKIAPSSLAPPNKVVPYRLPAASAMRPAWGSSPSLPLVNDAKVVIVLERFLFQTSATA